MTTPKLILLFAALIAIAASFFLPLSARGEEPARDAIIKELAESRDAKRAQALKEALKLEPDAALIQAVAPLLKDSANDVRRNAAMFFEKCAERQIPAGKGAQAVAEAKLETAAQIGWKPALQLAAAPLAGCLKDSDGSVRKSAAAALTGMGADALPALSELIALLAENDSTVRVAAGGVLEAIGEPAHEAVPALLKLIEDKNQFCRNVAAKALAKMGAPGLDGLLKLLASPRDDARTNAAQAFQFFGDAAVPELAALIKPDAPETALAAVAALNAMGGARDAAIPPLIALLREKTPALRQAAMQALNKCGARGVKPLLSALTSVCADAPPEYRTALTDALGRAGPAAVPPLIELIRAHGESAALCSAIEALGKTGAAAADATPMLIEMLSTAPPQIAPNVKRDKNQPPPAPVVPAYVKLDVAVLQALGSIGPRAGNALPILFELLKDGDNSVRGEAGRAISKIATGSEHIPPLAEIVERCDGGVLANALRPFQADGLNALLAEFDTPSATVRTRAANAFASMPVESVCPFLVAALKSDEPRIRSGAALALGDMRRMHKARTAAGTVINSDAVLNALKEAVKDPDPDVRVLAAYAFTKAVDVNDAELVGLVATGLANCSPDYRMRGLAALDYYNLEKAGHKAAAALPVLIRLAGQDIGGPASPRNLIQRIGVTAEDVPVLVEALKEKNVYSRKTVFRLLEALGPNAKEATPALIELFGDDERVKGKGGIDSVLAAIGTDAMPQMLDALRSLNQKKRQGIAQALIQMNLDGEWLARLADMLSDDRPEVRAAALSVLASNSERAKFALPHVRELLIDDDKFVCRSALELFSLLGPGATPVLIEALKDTRPNVRARAARALKPRGAEVPPPEAVKPLAELLKDDNSEVKAAALQALSACKDAAQAADIVAGLSEVMKDENTQTRRAALLYLKAHGSAAPAAAREALTPALKDTLAAVRINAIEALQTLGTDAAPDAPLLFEALGDPERRVRAAAADALEALGLASEPEKKIRIDEMFALDAIEQYAQAQEEFFIKTWDDNKVHYYAAPLKKVPELPEGIAAADAALEKAQPYKGYLFRMLDGQSAGAPGGEKKFVVDGKMSQGHALAAYPAEYGKSGRFTFMVGDDGTIYKKDLGAQTAKLGADLRELAPDDSWAKFKVRPKDEGPVRFHPLEPERVDDMEF